MLRRTLVHLAFTVVALGAVTSQTLNDLPVECEDCVVGCWVPQVQQFIPSGGWANSPTQCVKYYCTQTHVEVVSCGPVHVKPPCYEVRNLSLPYPYCCAQVVCPTSKV